MSMLLKELTKLGAPSGFEDAVRDFLKKNVTADEVYTDSIGNLICHKKGTGKKIMVAAHMDEVGLLVTGITDDGFLKFNALGGIETAVLCSKKVFIGENKIPGIVSAKAVHLQQSSEMTTPLKMKDMYIDIGASSRQDAEKKVSLGDFAVFDGEYTPFGQKLVKSKALDDRVGCATILKLMKESFDSDFYFVFTVQEEIGTRGARVAAFQIKPDIALILEGTTCSDVYGSKPHNQVTKLGDGAVLTAMDSAQITDKEFYNLIMNVAKEENIKLQIKKTTMGGTDAGTIQRSGNGVKTAVLAVPCRYIHSPVSVMNIEDYESLYKISLAVLKKIDRGGL